MKAVPGTDVCVHGSLFETLPAIVGAARWSLVTTDGWLKRGLLDDLSRADLAPTQVVIAEAPLRIRALYEPPPEAVETIVAVGGGSAIDRGKVVALGVSLIEDRDWVEIWRTTSRLPARLRPLPTLVAAPTLAGSGAESTPFATVWDGTRKRSMEHTALRPQRVVLDPAFHSRAPANAKLVAKLDCLSHACEAVWNLNANPATDELASEALRLLTGRVRGRAALQEIEASFLAGQAIAQTRTAIAHSISYALSTEMKLPHGLAAAITLPAVAEQVINGRPDRARVISSALDCAPNQIASRIAELLEHWGATRLLFDLASSRGVGALHGPFLDGVRSANFCLPVTENDARRLAFTAIWGAHS